MEKEMATHSSILAWRIPWAEEPDGLQSMGQQRIRHNWATNTKLCNMYICVYVCVCVCVCVYSLDQLCTNNNSIENLTHNKFSYRVLW